MVSRTVIVHTYAFKRVSALYVATPQRAGCDVGALNVPQDTRGASGIFKTSFTSHRVRVRNSHPRLSSFCTGPFSAHSISSETGWQAATTNDYD